MIYGTGELNRFQIRNKPKVRSRMDNSEKLATLGTQETGLRQTQIKQKTTKGEQHEHHQQLGVKPGVREVITVLGVIEE
jgi:hypothetical protein